MRKLLLDSLTDWIKVSGFVFVYCGFWMFMPPMIVGISVYLLYFKFISFVPWVLVYGAWFYYTRDWPEKGCMPSDFVRTTAFYYRWLCEYYSYRIVKTAELPADRNYILGCHPHGATCLGGVMYGYQMAINRDLYKGWTAWGVTLAGQFHWPLRRELLMWSGIGSASKENLEWLLRQEKTGQSVVIVIGGINEGIMSAPHKYRLKLKDRKGFVKIAMKEGADLVPVFNFGENETYEPVTGICPKRLRNMQAHLMNTFGFCPSLHMGRSLLGLPWGGLVPLQTRLETVIGDAIRVEKNPNPTQEQVDALHSAYCKNLNDLFETHKSNYDIHPEQKLILY